jgi:HK97 family phage portal protein
MQYPWTAIRKLFNRQPQTKPLPLSTGNWHAPPRSTFGGGMENRRVKAIPDTDAGYSFAYKTISDVFACVNTRSEAIASLNIKVVKIGTDIEVPMSPWYGAVDWAHEKLEQDLMYLMEYAMSIWGKNYLLKLVQEDKRTPGGVQWLNPQSVEPDIENGYIIAYEYSGGDGEQMTFGAKQVAYHHYQDSDDDNAGLPPLNAALDSANIKRSSQTFIGGFFVNNATVGGIITGRSKSAAFGGSSVPLTDGDQEKIIKQWVEQNGGARNAFKTVMLPWDLEYTPMGGEPPTAQVELTDDQRRNMHQVFRVPMSMTQAKDASDPLSSGSTITKDEAKFLGGWAIPEHKQLLLYLNTKVMPWLAPGEELVGDYTEVLGLISDTAERRDMIRADLGAGAITVNQYRIETGREPLDNGDVLFIPGGAVVTHVDAFGVTGNPVDETEENDSVISQPAPVSELSIVELNKIILEQLKFGVIDLATAAQLLGRTPTANQADMFWLGNQLVPGRQLQNIWKYGTLIAPSTTNAELLVESEPEALPTDEPVETLPALPEPVEGELPTPPATPTRGRQKILDEFTAWHKYLRKRVAAGKTEFREFNVEVIPDEWAHEMKAALALAGNDITMIDQFFADIIRYHKTAQSRLSTFENAFEDWMKEVASGKLPVPRARIILRNLWNVQGKLMFSEGLIDGGRVDGKPDKEDNDLMKKLIASQTPFIRRVSSELAAGNVNKLQREGKVRSWGRQFLVFYQEGLNSANKNQMLECVGTDGKSSCRTCQAIKGQIHPAKVWRKRELRPGIDHNNFECGTYENCHHILVPVEGGAKGTLPTQAQVSAWAAKTHEHNHDDLPPLEEQPYTLDQYDQYYATNGYEWSD